MTTPELTPAQEHHRAEIERRMAESVRELLRHLARGPRQAREWLRLLGAVEVARAERLGPRGVLWKPGDAQTEDTEWLVALRERVLEEIRPLWPATDEERARCRHAVPSSCIAAAVRRPQFHLVERLPPWCSAVYETAAAGEFAKVVELATALVEQQQRRIAAAIRRSAGYLRDFTVLGDDPDAADRVAQVAHRWAEKVAGPLPAGEDDA